MTFVQWSKYLLAGGHWWEGTAHFFKDVVYVVWVGRVLFDGVSDHFGAGPETNFANLAPETKRNIFRM